MRERQRHRQREKQAPCREPDVGLDPMTLESCPEPKADAQPLSHPGVPSFIDVLSFSEYRSLTFLVKYITRFFFFKILFIYSWETQRCVRERQRHRQREKQAPCREPHVGLDPRTPGPRPGPKAGAKPLSHPGIPQEYAFLNKLLSWFLYIVKLENICFNIGNQKKL